MKPGNLTLVNLVITIWVWCFTALALVFLVISGELLRLILFPFDREKFVPIRFLYSFLENMVLFINPFWNLTIDNRDKFSNHKSYVILSNQQLVMDIIVLQNFFKPFRWLSKAGNFRLPLLGWMMRIVKGIEIQRNNPASFADLAKECSHALQTGCSIAISPEGSRSEDGSVKRFKEGAFWNALHNLAPIIPMVLGNTLVSLLRKEFIIRKKYHLRLKMLNEMPFESFRELNPRSLALQVRDVIVNELESMRKENKTS